MTLEQLATLLSEHNEEQRARLDAAMADLYATEQMATAKTLEMEAKYWDRF